MAATKIMQQHQRNPLVSDGRGGPGDLRGPGDLKLTDLEERCKAYKAQLQKYDQEFQRLAQEMNDVRANTQTLERAKDNYRHQLSECKRDNDRLTEKLSLATNDKRELERKVEQLNMYIAQLQADNKGVVMDTKLLGQSTTGLQQLVDRLRDENSALKRERDELQEVVRKKLNYSENSGQKLWPNRTEKEKSPQTHSDKITSPSQSSTEDISVVQRRNHTPNHTPNHSLFVTKFSQDEEGGSLPTGNLGDAPSSDSTGSQGRSGPSHSFTANRKLSCSTSSLYGDNGASQDGRSYPTKLSEQTSRLSGRDSSDKRIGELSQQRLDLLTQVSALEQQRDDSEAKVKLLKQTLEAKEEQIARTTNELQEVKVQMEVLVKQKGVALRENTASYEQTMKLQTALQTAQVEKELLKAQHDVAVGERDKMVEENVKLRTKVERMVQQRQKDANDLSYMKLLKEKAVQEVGDLRKMSENQQREKSIIEQELGVVKDHLRSAIKSVSFSVPSSESVVKDMETLVGRLMTAESEKKALFRVLFDHDIIPHTEAMRRAEKLVSDRDGLLDEIKELQHTASKEKEDRILELKHKIEDLMMERDRLMGQCKTLTKENGTLNSKLSKMDEERESLQDEIKALTIQCNTLESTKNRLVEEQTRTLESADKLWKQRPIGWDDAWEDKQIEFALGPDGLAGFSVAGGRDQPQLPNPGAILVTMVTKGSPADGQLKVGDVLEMVNNVNLSCADHRVAVRAVKECQGVLRMVVKRRKHASTIQMGIASVINGLEPRMEEQEFSLMVKGKEGIGFKYDWSSMYTVTEVTSNGPADQILKSGDRIAKINGTSITKEKPSAVKKLMKPHHTILKLLIQRQVYPDETRPPVLKPQSVLNPMPRPTSSGLGRSRGMSGSSNGSWKNDKETDKENSSNSDNEAQSQSPERYSHSSKPHSDGPSQTSEDSSRPTKLVPNKLVAKVTRVRQGSGGNQQLPKPSDMDGEEEACDEGEDYNERRIEYGDVLLSEATGSQVYDSYLSECSYDAYPSSTSQSIDLTFHSAVPAVSHNRLTVDTMTATCPQDPPSQPSSDDDTSLVRNHTTRNTCIRKPSMNSTSSGKEEHRGGGGGASQDSTPRHHQRKARSRSKSKSIHGSMSQVSEVTPISRGRSRSSSSLNHGKSWSNLTHACSMTSVQEEETRRSTSSTNISQTQDNDPLTGATYIRANYTFVPRNPKEMSVLLGNVFHIHDEQPSERFRASFWVSRLNPDGTDAQIGPIPNSTRAQQYIEEQGETIDVPLYEEVEPFTQPRPVLIFGALADQVVSHLLESYPGLFYQCAFEVIEAMGTTTGRLMEVRLNRDLSEGKIIDFRRTESGNSFAVLKKQALVSKEHKGQHCLLVGSKQVLRQLKDVAPPISVFIKVISQDSISTFTTKLITPQYAAENYKEVLSIINDPQLSNEFSASIVLTHMDVLVQQIEEVIKKEKQKQMWIVAKRSAD